jgi:hypothetical protein
MKSTSKGVHSYFYQPANRVTNAGESSSQNLLLPFSFNVAVGTFAQDMMAELWDYPRWPVYGSNKSSAWLTSGVLTSLFLHSKSAASRMARACRMVITRLEYHKLFGRLNLWQ